ncbi:hypothetical protein ACQP2P_02400 [Dactylosporangium sp. CA-139114]|uniref:hypothetical protein n=1 Tax=Dactylosporangium sp. CA-139114 TaxID=3239931 RepID=UPI003D967033
MFAEVPPRVVYSLTPLGRDANGPLSCSGPGLSRTSRASHEIMKCPICRASEAPDISLPR